MHDKRNTTEKKEMNVDFGQKHLVGLAWLLPLIAIVLTVLLVIRKKGKFGESYDKRVIRYTCYFMWAWEIVKTVRMINFDDFGPVGHYPVWMAPFHICSMGLYAYLIVGAKKDSKLAKWVRPFAYAVLMIVTSIILTIPASSGILGTPENWNWNLTICCLINLGYITAVYCSCLCIWYCPVSTVRAGGIFIGRRRCLYSWRRSRKA